jgi:hypothetical protein
MDKCQQPVRVEPRCDLVRRASKHRRILPPTRDPGDVAAEPVRQEVQAMSGQPIIRAFFDEPTNTVSYLVADPATR